jgi:cobalt-zinc-cadmium resistance protein CzcA
MEEIDMIIKLHPKKDWVLAHNKEQLAVKFKEALAHIPDVEYEFTQPIEMRFNELITGVRSDIAIKLYGENLNYLNNKASEIKDLVSNVPGAVDVILEKTTGLPQIKVEYNRQKLALYHMDVSSLNTYLSAAFGGAEAGILFEGEKRFDIVLRLQNQNRKDISDVKNLLVQTPNSGQVPLSEFAHIEFAQGPAKISRDNTQRRVVVSVNVRNRDLQSVIQDIRNEINKEVQLKPGYHIEYGGQFKNLQSATKRLLIAVPVALILIFVFLHFAFQSFKDALMIFTAIPLATVGGVFLLWVRDMPFSVSSGVGFIALFGIAVLNGIVLIEHFKDLQKQGIHDMKEIIFQGTKDRLRPVLLTASAAAMGFLPMAISTGAGAEVQRPLATVVIGGLVSSTMLTMIALPLLYEIFYTVKKIKLFPLKIIRSKTTFLLVLVFASSIVYGQHSELQLEQLTQLALENNTRLKAYSLKIKQAEAARKASIDIPKTYISYGYDENNIAENGFPLRVWSVEQNFSFPSLYKAKSNASHAQTSLSEKQYELEKLQLLKDLSILYYECITLNKKILIHQQLDSIYSSLLKKYELKKSLNDINKLEYLQIKSKRNAVFVALKQLQSEFKIHMNRLKLLVNSPEDFRISLDYVALSHASISSDSILIFNYLQLQRDYNSMLLDIAKRKALPDLKLNYFVGSNRYQNASYYHGIEIGMAVPLFYGSYKNSIQSTQFEIESKNQLNRL